MAERRVKVPYQGNLTDGTDVPIEESTERWSEFKLEDGTIIRIKQTIASAIRVDGQYDQEGNPVYVLKSAPAVAIVHVEEKVRRPVS